MKKYKFTPLAFSILTSSFLILQGCTPDSLTKYKKEEPQRATASSSSPTSAPNLATLESFQLKNITQNSTSYYLHKYGAGNENVNCEIPKTDLTNGDIALTDGVNDILCWLEAEEIQLFFNGADFQINTPIGLCEYTQIKPYYFWNAPPLNTNKIITTVTCADSHPQCAIEQAAANAANLANGFTTDVNGDGTWDTNEICEGDYTDLGGKNCDEGQIITVEKNVTENGAVNTTSSTEKCGGKRTACYEGPGVDLRTNASGFPVPVNYLSMTGQSVNYSVMAPGPFGKGYPTNHYIANFTQTFATGLYVYDYTQIASATGLEIYSADDATTNPTSQITYLASDPLKRADTTRSYPVQIYYEFSCMNYSNEVKGRIRLQIREWNKKFAYPVTSEVAEASPAALVRQSLNSSDYETSGVGYWNDVYNWDTPIPYGNPAAFVPPYPTLTTDTGFAFPYLGFTFQ